MRVVDGRAIIDFWGGWPCLLSEIPFFGKVLAITRNSHAVVGTISDYPEVDFCPAGTVVMRQMVLLSSTSHFGERHWPLWKRAPQDGSIPVEFSDPNGEVIHKVCLTERSNFEAFRSWVELSQTPADSEIHFRDLGRDPCREDSVDSSKHSAELGRSEAGAFFQLAARSDGRSSFCGGNDDAVADGPDRGPRYSAGSRQ